MSQRFKIELAYTTKGTVFVEADSLDEAIETAEAGDFDDMYFEESQADYTCVAAEVDETYDEGTDERDDDER